MKDLGNRLENLLDKAKDGSLLRHELEDVIAELSRNRASGDETYTRLYIVGRVLAMDQEDLVASFLCRPDDPMLSKLALQILCGWWDLGEKYLANLKEFLAGVAWDEDEDVRLIAISDAGEYLRTHHDRELLVSLLEIVGNQFEDDLIQSSAVESLARGLGDDWTSFPGLGGDLSEDDWTRDVISRARARHAGLGQTE